MLDMSKSSQNILNSLAMSLQGAAHLDDQKNIFAQFIVKTGFDKFFYIPLSFENDDHIKLHCSNFPKPFIDAYLKNEHIFADPMIISSRAATLPVTWSSDQINESLMTKQARDIKSLYQQYGLKRGLSITVRGARNRHAVLLAVCTKSEQEFQFQADSHHLTIMAAGYLYHNAMSDLLRNSPFYQHNDYLTLTSKQQEILRLAALGKSKWEISVIIGMSEATVHYHLRDIGRRLETQGVTATVAKALSLGYISL